MRLNRLFLYLTVGLAICFWTCFLRAQEAAVYVSFSFKPPVSGLFKDTLAVAELNVSKEIVKLCNAKFRYWSFQVGEHNKYPLLTFWLVKTGSEYRLAGTLLPKMGLPDDELWSGVLFKPGDLDGTGAPSAKSWPSEVIRGIDLVLLEPKRESIRSMLQQQAPLGNTFAPVVTPPPRTLEEAQGILPLSWDKFSPLATSYFEIHSVWPQHGQVILLTKGIGLNREFPGNPKFPAIVVQFLEWEEAGTKRPIVEVLDRLGKINPTGFYLFREDTRGLALMADEPGGH